MEFNFYATLVLCAVVLLVGRFIIKRVSILHKYNIPEPVVGGIIAAILLLGLEVGMNYKITFDNSIKDPLMLSFFTSIGLSADFSSLKKGGRVLIVFLVCVTALLVCQNIVGIALAEVLGVNHLLGLLSGSITMIGGHGTGVAWAEVFREAPYNFSIGLEVAAASATFGLVMGGVVGGPVARYLIRKHNLKPNIAEDSDYVEKTGDYKDENLVFETPKKEKLITAETFIESLALIAIALLIGTQISNILKDTSFTLPTFVWCLFIGVLLRNGLSVVRVHKVFDREVSVIGNVSLSLFLALALMTINLIDLVSLAVPIIVILCAQVAFVIFFVIFITFRFTGRDYDAAVLCSGCCGFGLGATPTAMVNMQTVTRHYGPSHMAFIIVPLVGAFFIDLINAVAVRVFLALPFFT